MVLCMPEAWYDEIINAELLIGNLTNIFEDDVDYFDMEDNLAMVRSQNVESS